jgi:pectate lyase
MNTVIRFADNVLKYGRDIYRENPSPLFADGLNLRTKEHLAWRFPDGHEAVISNMACQQNLFRVLTGLSNLTGEPGYKDAAKAAIAYHFENYQDESGLMQWGGHRLVDLRTLEAVGPHEKKGTHELKYSFPYYELMYEVDPRATAEFLKGFWNAHVLNWRTLEISRHGKYGVPMGPLWDHDFQPRPPFFQAKGLSFLSAGSDLIYAGIKLYQLTGDQGALLWGKRLAEQYVNARHPETRLGAYLFTQPEKRAETDNDGDTHSKYGDRAQRQLGPELGPVALEGNLLLPEQVRTVYSRNALMQLQLEREIGQDALDLLEWTKEGLLAYQEYAYIPETNLLRPMLTDGTDLSDYTLKRNGYFGQGGQVLSQFPADTQLLLSYARAFASTGEAALWDVVRSMAKGNGLGDLGIAPGENLDIRLGTTSDDPFCLFALLEVYRHTEDRAYLKLARVIGANIVSNRFRHGFFAPRDSIYANIDAIEPYALLALEAATTKAYESVPGFVNGSGYLDGDYLKPDGTVVTIHSSDLFRAKSAHLTTTPAARRI